MPCIFRVGFTSFPREPTNEDARNFEFDSGLRTGYFRHLFIGNRENVEKKSQPSIALSHFSEEVLILNEKHLHGPYFIKKISIELGRKIGLSGVDRVAGSEYYYALPNQTVEDVQGLLSRKENERFAHTAGLATPARGVAHRISSSSKVAVRQAIAFQEAERVLSAEKDRKQQLINADDIKIKSSLTDRQAKYFKRIQKENKGILVELQKKLAESEAKCDLLEGRLSEEKDASSDMSAKHDSDIKEQYSSGLQRRLILSDNWHASNPLICGHIFGFHSFEEFKVYCKCLFPEIILSYGNQQSDLITEWEKCAMVKLRMRRSTTLQMIGSIWSRNRNSVAAYMSEWAPRWEVVGSYLSELDLTQEYLDSERPKIFTDADQVDVAILVDGKDFMIDDPKKNSALKRAVWSDKVHHAAGRLITWSTPSGLTVEHTPLYMGRATESSIVALWGSYHGVVPLDKVPEIRPDPLRNEKAERYEDKCPILSKIIKEKRIKDAEREDVDNDDGELVVDDDELGEAQADNNDSAPSIDLTERGCNFLDRMRKREAENKPCKKYSANAIVKFNDILRRSGPNQSSTTKLDQLEIHEQLHIAYQNGRIRKCQLSFYLNEMEPLRADMMRHLRGEAGNSAVPVVKTRLAKLPIGSTVLADRGFYYDAPSYPNVNAQVTPHFLTGRDQFESNEISCDLVTCRLRWSSEAVFSRVTDHNALTDVIPYSYFPILSAMIEWGHAHANLMQPFNKPPNY